MGTQTANVAAEQHKSVKESPFACNMLALNVEERRRHQAVTTQVQACSSAINLFIHSRIS
jgi:hypothetical protein